MERHDGRRRLFHLLSGFWSVSPRLLVGSVTGAFHLPDERDRDSRTLEVNPGFDCLTRLRWNSAASDNQEDWRILVREDSVGDAQGVIPSRGVSLR